MKKNQISATSTTRKVLFIEDMVEILGKKATTIRTCASWPNCFHLIPRPWKMPASRRLCWYEDEVFAWIEAAKGSLPQEVKRKRGRPTKRQQLVRYGLVIPTKDQHPHPSFSNSSRGG